MKVKPSAFLAFIIVFYCNSQVAQAASFDCKIASSQVEKLICSDQSLSMLDSSLGELYSSRKKNNPGLIKEQKQWLLETRNVCRSSACLSKAYSNRIKVLRASNSCQISENALLGGWVEYKGEGTFEEMQFSTADGEKQFTSWRHHRPDIIGSWKLEKCVVHVKHTTEEALHYSMTILKLKNNKLYLFDTDSQSEVVYRFVK